MAVSRGKIFEKIIETQLSEDSRNLVERLHDQTTGYKNSTNPADYILFRNSKLFYIECKSTKGASIPITNLTQLDRMLPRVRNRQNVFGVFIIWFVDKKLTYWVDCIRLNELINSYGYKSLNFNVLEHLSNMSQSDNYFIAKIPAVYPRINGKYDFNDILDLYEGD